MICIWFQQGKCGNSLASVCSRFKQGGASDISHTCACSCSAYLSRRQTQDEGCFTVQDIFVLRIFTVDFIAIAVLAGQTPPTYDANETDEPSR